MKQTLNMSGHGETEHGRYRHRYSGSFHRVSFCPFDEKKHSFAIVFNQAAHPEWDVNAEKAVQEHHASLS